mgnify:CR=1 FL=1
MNDNENNVPGGFPGGQVMLNLDAMDENPKYITSIREANNGFSVYVEKDMSVRKHLTQKEAQRKVSELMSGITKKLDRDQDPILSKIQDDIEEEQEADEIKLELGLHVFYTFKEMTAFLAFVYTKNEQ